MRVVLVVAGLLAGAAGPAGADEAYRAEVQAWRDAREAGLMAEDSWLTLVGLYWLKEGPNRLGSDPSSHVVLPERSSPGTAGSFFFENGRVTLTLEPGVDGRIDEERVTGPRLLRPDTAEHNDILQVGNLAMYVIERGGRFAIRVKDRTSPVRTGFTGLSWYPIDEAYRVEARWVPYDPPRSLRVPNVLGEIEIRPSPGRAEFELGGQTLRLDGILEDPEADELFFILRDKTSGKGTYGAGRFLYADLPRVGRLILDFNKSYNPPCAFTPYATCPLPPRQNWLPVPVEAGEQAYGDATH